MKISYTLKTAALPLAALCLLAATPAGAVTGDGTFSSKIEVKTDASGDYDSKTSTESTDTAGTTTTSSSKEKIDVDANGNTTAEKTDKTTVDPKGLGNKSSAETTESSKAKANGELDAKSVSDAIDTNGTEDKAETRKTVSLDLKGHKKTKLVHRKIHDPKGLMNKTVSETTDTTVEKDNGQTETTHETKVNGQTTEKIDQVQ